MRGPKTGEKMEGGGAEEVGEASLEKPSSEEVSECGRPTQGRRSASVWAKSELFTPFQKEESNHPKKPTFDIFHCTTFFLVGTSAGTLAPPTFQGVCTLG